MAAELQCSLTPVTGDVAGRFLAGEGIARTRKALESGELPAISADGLRMGARIARTRIGGLHRHELRRPMRPKPAPFQPKSGGFPQVRQHRDLQSTPRSSRRSRRNTTVVVGKEASYLSAAEDAVECIGGYLVANHLSERESRLPGAAGQWTKGQVPAVIHAPGAVAGSSGRDKGRL